MTGDAWSPRQYDKFKKERSQPFYDLMSMLQPVLGASIIDLGCGTGELTADLHSHMQARSTLGVDSSAEMLKKAQTVQAPGLAFKTGNIETWRASGEYDVVFSNAALQWCPGHPALFARIHKALRAGGQMAVQMPMNHDYATHVLATQMSQEEPWRGLLGAQGYSKDKTMLSVEEYAKLLFDLGFKEQKVTLNVYGHVLDSREGVIEWVKGTLLTTFKSRLSETDYARFLQEFRERLFQQLPDDKPFFYPFKRILMWARA